MSIDNSSHAKNEDNEAPGNGQDCPSLSGDGLHCSPTNDDGCDDPSAGNKARFDPSADDEARYRPFLSTVSRLREPVMIRKQQEPLEGSCGPPIDLCAGLPSRNTFPFVSATFTLSDGSSLKLGPDKMAAGLQYISGKGHPALLEYLHRSVVEEHDPTDMTARDILVTSGAQDGIALALQMLVDPGDGLVIPEFCYSTVLSAMCPLQPRLIPVLCDEFGLVVEKLREAVQDARQHCRIKVERIDKALYLTPIGNNPTGITIPTVRRREIYEVVCQHDLIILEDDAYYHLQLDDSEEPLESFLRLDTENRVIRFDSFSKTIGPGLRLGWMVAPKPLAARLYYHMQSSVIHPSALSQMQIAVPVGLQTNTSLHLMLFKEHATQLGCRVLVVELLQLWGPAGLEHHLDQLRADYRHRRDVMVSAAEKHLQGLAEWKKPSGGTFLWIRLLKVGDVSQLAQVVASRAGVLVVPGNSFTSCPPAPCPYIRCSFSSTDPQLFDEAFKILADVIKSAANEDQRCCLEGEPGITKKL